MVSATSRHDRVVRGFSGTDHVRLVHAFPGWAVALVYLAILGILFAWGTGMARAATRMSRPAKIVVGLVAVWTVAFAIVAFLDGYRPTGDWGGSLVEAAFAVLYGLVAATIVWAVDKTAKRIWAGSPV